MANKFTPPPAPPTMITEENKPSVIEAVKDAVVDAVKEKVKEYVVCKGRSVICGVAGKILGPGKKIKACDISNDEKVGREALEKLISSGVVESK